MKVHSAKLLLVCGAATGLFVATNFLLANCIRDCTVSTAFHYESTKRVTFSRPIAAVGVWSMAAQWRTSPADPRQAVRTWYDVWWANCEAGCPNFHPCGAGNYGGIKQTIVEQEKGYNSKCVEDSE